MKARRIALFSALYVGAVLSAGLASTARADVFSNVPETAGYTLAYQLAIGTNDNFSGGVPYTVDNTAAFPIGSFARIGYYLELQASGGPLQWVYASFDAAPFSTTASKLGVPIASTGEFYHTTRRTCTGRSATWTCSRTCRAS